SRASFSSPVSARRLSSSALRFSLLARCVSSPRGIGTRWPRTSPGMALPTARRTVLTACSTVVRGRSPSAGGIVPPPGGAVSPTRGGPRFRLTAGRRAGTISAPTAIPSSPIGRGNHAPPGPPMSRLPQRGPGNDPPACPPSGAAVAPDAASTAPEAQGTGPYHPGPGQKPLPDRCPGPEGYEILGEIGHGGMGVVYRARQRLLKRLVALKMIKGGAGSEVLRARFRAEAEAVARLRHPNIVQVHEVGELDGQLYCALEYVPGGSLDRALPGTTLPPRAAARLVELLARAMHAAHEVNLVHRDLKPANVLLEDAGRPPQEWSPKVTDFGLAKFLDENAPGMTQADAIMGTPSYMAPEQAL